MYCDITNFLAVFSRPNPNMTSLYPEAQYWTLTSRHRHQDISVPYRAVTFICNANTVTSCNISSM